MFWTRRDRHLTEEELSAYIDGELAASRRIEATIHVDACPQCSTALAGLREVRALVSRLPEAELPRSFVLSPQMASVQPGRAAPAAPRRSPSVFAPAVAFTLLVALFAVDLASSGSSSNDELGGGGDQALSAKDSSSGAGAASESAERSTSTFSAPTAPEQVAPAPSTTGPAAAQGITPPTPGGIVPAPATGSGVAPDALPTPTVPSTSSPRTGQGLPPAPSTGDAPAVAGQAQPEATIGTAETYVEGRDEGDASTANRLANDDGDDWLRIAQVLAAIAFVASLGFVFGPGLFKKGR